MNDKQINTAELRRLAEQAIKAMRKNEDAPGNIRLLTDTQYALQRFNVAANPAAIIALLDRMEAAENVCAKLDAAIMLPFWTVAEANVEMEKFAELIDEWRKSKEWQKGVGGK